MSIVRLDHYNIAPKDFEATVRFYEDVIGLKVGPRPEFGVDGYWLYADDRAVLHLLTDDKRSTGPTGRLDHIAFWATGLAEFVGRLKRMGIAYMLRTVEVAGMHQVFLTDVDGVTLEVGFASSEPVPDDAGRRMGL
jgi:catechol 2,3-dioxygenase-like lactoylglutathione lyase family enzyme